MSSTTIDKLVAGCAKGDRKCQQIIYEKFYSKMMGVCLRYASNKQEAQDLVHDGFIKVFEKIYKYNYSGSFEGWVRRIMINTSIDHYRKNKNIFIKENQDFANIEGEEPDQDILSQLRTEDIMKAVQSLSPGYRAVFNLYVVEGYSHKEVSDELGISVGTSKSNLAKAKKNLRQLFIRENKEPNISYNHKSDL
ncbi:MAG TPA: sigma-70 family RNA polymerase sigma factor [Flavobacteriales bacterium]|nr:sigma-70 family RNA polymerase sigma factor [Flavobacteriales bacterium]